MTPKQELLTLAKRLQNLKKYGQHTTEGYRESADALSILVIEYFKEKVL